jgi:hypothetical protein
MVREVGLGKILFTGDVCVNGPYNFVGHGDIGKWIATPDAAKKLGANVVCTGNGPRAANGVLDDALASAPLALT